MNIRRMMGVAALGAAATTLVLGPGAGAQTPAYTGSSSGEALNLSVFGQGLTVGSTNASVDSSPAATATGTGLATPVVSVGASAASIAEPGDGADVCEALVDQIPGLTIGLACSSSQVTTGDTTTATATGRIGTIALNPVAQLLDTPLADVIGPVQGGIDQLLGALQPVLGPVDDATDLGLEDTLNELFDQLFAGAELVRVTVGDTASTTSADAGTVTTACAAEGARIDVLDAPPLAGIDVPPVLSIIVGQAGTEVVVDRATGTGTPTVTPALVTIEAPTVGVAPITVPIGQTIEIPLPEPLGSSFIRVADGVTGTNEDGSTYATANAVSIDLLNGEALMGGVELELAGCTSVAGVTVEAAAPPVTEAPAPPPAERLPTTGSDDTGTLALAGVVGLAGLGLALLRRSGSPA